jgi:hypothetical protein
MARNGQGIKYSDLVRPDSSISDLIKQLTELQDTYKSVMQSIRTDAAQTAAATQKATGATAEGREATKRAASDAERLAQAQKQLSAAQSDVAKKLAEVNLAKREANQLNALTAKLNKSEEGSYNRLSAQYSINKIRLNAMTQAQRENTAEGKKLVEQTREIYEQMKQLQEATGKYQLNVGNYTQASDAIQAYGDRLKESLGLNSQFGESILALGRGGTEAKAVLGAMGDGVKALGKTFMTLLTNPAFLAIAGIAGAGVAFKWWYDYNKGLVEATRLTQQFTGKEGDALKTYRNEVQAVADMFDKDFKEVLISTNAVAKQFGISADESLQYIKDGFIAGADANGEFLDTLKEYPAYFKEAGISADQFVAIIAQTTQSGIFSDKGIDAIKEANLRLREMTTATADALDGIGISSEQVQADLQSGAKTTFQVMQEVSAKLNELPESSAAVGTAIADIFGGPGEDAGLHYLRTLKDISTNLDDVKDKAGILGQLQEEQLQSQIELQNALSGLFDATGGTFETLTTRAKVFVNQGLTAIIKGVVSIINYFIDLYNESVAFRAVWQTIVVGFKNTFDTIGNLFNAFIDIVKATGTALKGAFTLDFDLIKKGYADYAKAYGNFVKAQVQDITENIQQGVENARKKVKPITIPVATEAQTTDAGTRVTTNAPKPVNKDNAAKAVEDEQKKVEEAYKKNLSAIRKLQDEQLKLETDEWAKRTQQTKYQYSRQIEDLRHQLETEKDLTTEQREAMTATIKVLEQQQTNALKKIEEDRQEQELEMVKQGIELRLAAVKKGSAEEKQLQIELAEAERKIEIAKSGGVNVDLINAKYDAEIEAIKNASDKVKDIKKENEQLDLYDVLGLNVADDKKKAINDAVSYAISSIQSLMQARTEAANAAVEAADREVEAAQNALELEMQARANGYANNVSMARKELDLAKKNQDKALKEQQQAQRQQELINTATQVSSLVTASANIWRDLGFPWAIPALAVMWASFAAAKVTALQAAGTEKYGDGTVELLQGGSHQSGNDIDLGRKPDGTRRRAEGGEFFAVINKRNSRRFRKIIPNVINALNDGSFANKYLAAYDGANGISMNIGGGPDIADLKRDVREIREQGDRRTYVDGRGNTVIIYKNLKQTIKS